MKSITMSLLDPNKIDFEPELKKFCDRTGERISRIHFYDLLIRQWFLFAKNGDLSQGWIIISYNKDLLTLEPYIRLEMAYSDTDYNFAASVEKDLEQLAKDVDAKYIEFKTQFLPIVNHGIAQGYEIANYTCRKQIEY